MPQRDMRFEDDNLSEEEDLVSIADKVEGKQQEVEVKPQGGCSWQFMNPSCFLDNMKPSTE